MAILHLEVESNSSVITLDDGNFIEYEDGMSVKTIVSIVNEFNFKYLV